MSGTIPVIKSKGVFEVKAPFATDPKQTYVCEEIRTFDELSRLGWDVVSKVYSPAGLGESEFSSDRSAGASIITLKPNGGIPLYIPSTYLLSYPGMSASDYEVRVLVVECGLLPRGFDTSKLREEIADLVKATLGATSHVMDSAHRYDGVLTPEEIAKLETARNNAVANYVSKDTKIKESSELIDSLTDKNNKLTETIISLTNPSP